MRLIRPLALLALLLVPLLTACDGSPPAVIEAPRQIVPPNLLTCPEQPEPPTGAAGDRAVAGWIVDLATAGGECRANLAATKEALGQ